MSEGWKTLGSKYVLENPWFKVRQDKVVRPDGTPGTYNVIENADTVIIIPIDAAGRITLVRQLRYATQHESWEFPAGGVEVGEEPLAAAERELREETGFGAGEWQTLGSPIDMMGGSCSGAAHVFMAKGLSNLQHDLRGEEGITAVRKFTSDEIMELIQDGKMLDAACMAVMLRFLLATDYFHGSR